MYVDREIWEKVMFNLLSNALKFTSDGSIAVRVAREDTADGVAADAIVTVTDTGIGIPAAEMPRLFERFHRIETAGARSTEGSGIGLALVKELVGLHGGTITADSREGIGTTFTVRLPIGAAHLPAHEVAPAPAHARRTRRDGRTLRSGSVALAARRRQFPSRRNGVRRQRISRHSRRDGRQPTRVLVADDNADMREYLTNLLRTSGYQVSGVTDGQQALEAIRAQVPDLVISDVMMPRLDGLQLLAALRTDSRTAAVPVLLLSARAGPDASIEGLLAGADDYLVKPFAAADLLARVRANVELARLRNHHARWRTRPGRLAAGSVLRLRRSSVPIIEINTAFTEILGYGPEQLPYEAPHPLVARRRHRPGSLPTSRSGVRATAEPVGRRLHRSRDPPQWASGVIAVNFNHVDDPESRRRVMVGTFRDVTAEHYAVQRQIALAALNQQLAQADTLDDALRGAAEELRRVWQARRVLAATFFSGAPETAKVADCLVSPHGSHLAVGVGPVRAEIYVGDSTFTFP